MQFLNFSTELRVELGMALSMNLHVSAGISSLFWGNGSCGIMGIALPLVRLLRLRTMAIRVFGPIKNATSELAITHTSTHTKLNAKQNFSGLACF